MVLLKLGGYFPKQVLARPEWLQAANVAEVCSVSTCMSPGPEGAIDLWLHNDFGWYDRPEVAKSVVPRNSPPHRLFAYRVSLRRFRQGNEEDWVWPAIDPTPLGPAFQTRGFDAVSKSIESSLWFECSPLSCCNMAKELGANKYCLIDTLQEALRVARFFSVEQPEPGPYYVVEVLEEALLSPPN